MKIIKTANANEVTLSKSEWQKIGYSAGWMKTAKKYSVQYYPKFNAPIQTKIIRIDPQELENRKFEDVVAEKVRRDIIINREDKSQKGLDAAKKLAKGVIIEKTIPHGTARERLKPQPSQKDLQKLRGEKMRAETEKRRHLNELRSQLKDLGVPPRKANQMNITECVALLNEIEASSPKKIIENIQNQDSEKSLVELLNSRKVENEGITPRF